MHPNSDLSPHVIQHTDQLKITTVSTDEEEGEYDDDVQE